MKPIDLAGQRFRMLLVKERAPRGRHTFAYWRCICDCGNERVVPGHYLRNKLVWSCGCASTRNQNFVGRKFHRLSVIGQAPSRKNKRMWKCMCDCGATRVCTSEALLSGKTKSCGCYKLELMRVSNLRHGKTKTKTHKIWGGMLKRCQTPTCLAFRRYGGRGIKVCERWQTFENFLADMGECPSADHSIERQDVDGNYEPGNCIWLLRSQQSMNTSRTRRITIDGETKPLWLWCEESGRRYGLVYDRITKLGWSLERALQEAPHA